MRTRGGRLLIPSYQEDNLIVRFKWLYPAAALGALLAGTSAFAAPTAEYTALRNSLAPATLAPGEALTAYAGQVIELTGAVGTIYPRPDAPGFTLQRTDVSLITVHGPVTDADIAAGATLRVLGRVYANGLDLDELSVTPAKTPAPARRLRRHAHRQAIYTSATTSGTASGSPQWFAARIRAFSGGVSGALALKIANAVLKSSARYGVDPRLVCALLAQESHFNPHAVSPVGARGLGQLMPGTAAQMGIRNPYDVAQNVNGAVRYLATQLQRFNGDTGSALAAYNAGPGSVQRFGGIPPYRETRNYVRVISRWYQQMKVQSL